MGLDCSIDHSCAYRPGGDFTGLTRMLRAEQMAATMDRHGLPSITLRHLRGEQAEERVVHRADLEADARAVRALPQTCAGCPAGALTGAVPGCQGRLDYPIDDEAVAAVRDALQLTADRAASDEDLALVRAVVADRDCDGSRMFALVRRLDAAPAPIGFAPVDVVLDGRTVAVSAYMLLEHVCFRATLDRDGQAALLRWFSFFFDVVGDPTGWSRSIAGLDVLHRLVQHAHRMGAGMTFDG